MSIWASDMVEDLGAYTDDWGPSGDLVQLDVASAGKGWGPGLRPVRVLCLDHTLRPEFYLTTHQARALAAALVRAADRGDDTPISGS